MKQILQDSLGVKVKILVYATSKEGNDAAGKDGSEGNDAVLDECNRNLVYRGALPEARDTLLEAVEAETGIERKTEQVNNADGTPKKKEDGTFVLKFAETEGEYMNRVCAKLGVEKSHFQPLADKMDAIAVDIKATERKPGGPKKLPNDYLESAKRIFGNGNQDKWAATLGITFTGDVEKDQLALGWKIKEREDAKRKEKLVQDYA